MRRVALITIVPLALAAPLIAQDDQHLEVETAIVRSASAFSRALEAGDAGAMAAQYTEDATLIPPNGRLVNGRQAIEEFWMPRNPAFRTLRHELTTDRLEVSGDVAIEVGTWFQQGQVEDREPTESSGRYVVVWRRQGDGEWKMQFDSWTRPFEAPPEP